MFKWKYLGEFMSNREELVFSREDSDRLVRIEATLQQVLTQATKTNGRVDSLEDKHEELSKSVSRLKWFSSGVSAAVSTIAVGFYYFVGKP
jgi:hypothetical protein